MATNYILGIQVRAHQDPGAEASVKKVYNTFNFVRSNLTGTPVKSAAVTAFLAGPFSALLAASSIAYLVDSIYARFIDNANDVSSITIPGTQLSGQVTGDCRGSLNSVRLQFRTANRQPPATRGAVSLMGPANTNALLDNLSAAGQTAYNAFAASLLAGFTDGSGFTWNPIVISTKYSWLRMPKPLPAGAQGPPAPPINVIYSPITSIIVNPNIGRMKRRQNLS